MLSKGDDQLSKTSDILSVSLAYVFIFAFCVKVGFAFSTPRNSEVTKAEALINAYQVWELQIKNAEKKEGPRSNVVGSINRGLASLDVNEKQGKISKDLWDAPYNFQIQIREDQKKQIIVWSNGPDHKNSSEDTLPNFSGDDVGNILVTNL